MTDCTSTTCSFGRQCVGGDGSLDAPLLIIMEAPGKVELREGKPAVGPAGQLMNKLLASAGIDRYRETRILNTVQCVELGRRPATPTLEEISSCHDRLLNDIEETTSKVILCLGATAQQVLIPGLNVTNSRGRIRWWNERLVVATYHPSAVLRGGHAYESLIQSDMELVRGLMDE